METLQDSVGMCWHCHVLAKSQEHPQQGRAERRTREQLIYLAFVLKGAVDNMVLVVMVKKVVRDVPGLD